jgi:hypothetical protein
MADNVVVVFMEGASEKRFYVNFISYIREKNGNALPCIIDYKNLKGIGNYKRDARTHIENSIANKYPGARITALLCHDTDVFEHAKKPPVNWVQIQKELLRIDGVERVDLIKARESLEDWFLHDKQGLLNFLNLPQNTKTSGQGYKVLLGLFKKASKVYVKGSENQKFVDSLNIGLIASHVCKDIKPLCRALGMECKTVTCK